MSLAVPRQAPHPTLVLALDATGSSVVAGFRERVWGQRSTSPSDVEVLTELPARGAAATANKQLAALLRQERPRLLDGVRVIGVGARTGLAQFGPLLEEVLQEHDALLSRTGPSRGIYILLADTEDEAFNQGSETLEGFCCVALARDRGKRNVSQAELCEEASWVLQLLTLDGTRQLESAVLPVDGQTRRVLIRTVEDGLLKVERHLLLTRGKEQVEHLLRGASESEPPDDAAIALLTTWHTRQEGRTPLPYHTKRQLFRVRAEEIVQRVASDHAGLAGRLALRDPAWSERVVDQLEGLLSEEVVGLGRELGEALTGSFDQDASSWRRELLGMTTGSVPGLGLLRLQALLEGRRQSLTELRRQLGAPHQPAAASLARAEAITVLERARHSASRDLGRMPPEHALGSWLGLGAALAGILLTVVLRLLGESLGPADPAMRTPGWEAVLYYIHLAAHTAMSPPWVGGLGVVLALGTWRGLLKASRDRVLRKVARHFGPLGALSSVVADVTSRLNGVIEAEGHALEEAIDARLVTLADRYEATLRSVLGEVTYTGRCLDWLQRELEGACDARAQAHETDWTLQAQGGSHCRWSLVPPLGAFTPGGLPWQPTSFWGDGLVPTVRDSVDEQLLWPERFLDRVRAGSMHSPTVDALSGGPPSWEALDAAPRHERAERTSSHLAIIGADLEGRLAAWAAAGQAPPWRHPPWNITERCYTAGHRIYLIELVQPRPL